MAQDAAPTGRHRLRGGAAAAADAGARDSGPDPRCPAPRPSCSPDGTAAAPAEAPAQVKQAIWAANALQELPYRYGGGHNLKFDVSDGADCSGTVSFALKAARPAQDPARLRLVHAAGARRARATGSRSSRTPATPTPMIAGLRLDTSVAGMARRRNFAASAFERGPRWRPMGRSPRGFVKRHPLSF